MITKITKLIDILSKRFLVKVLIFVFIIVNVSIALVALSHEVFDFTSSNSALYITKNKHGKIEIKRDLLFEESDSLLYMINLNPIFRIFTKEIAVAKNKPILELTWDIKSGRGNIKQFRPDGTMFSLTLSRFKEGHANPQGLFIGGELPLADADLSEEHNTSGFSYYDGNEWHHIWCALNEGIRIYGTNILIMPSTWKYLGSKVLKNSQEEIILESNHEARFNIDYGPNNLGILRMKRQLLFRAGDDYFIVRTKLSNIGNNIINYGYIVGDEPWIGDFGSSYGDVGWYQGGLIEREDYLSPFHYNYAGYWDRGNHAAGEKGSFSGYANFIQWFSPVPSFVYFANQFDKCCSKSIPLWSNDNRVINLLWNNQGLLPGQSKQYVLAFGMARINPLTGFPQKPQVYLESKR